MSVTEIDTALTFVTLLCAGRLIWVDFRQFEIEPPTLAVMAGTLLLQAGLTAPAAEVLIRLVSALAFYGAVVFLTRTVRGLSRVGAGDPPLIGVVAFMVFPFLVPWSLLAAVLILITAATYARIRGKRVMRSMFPAAPPLLGAAAPVYLLVTLGG